MNPTWWAIEMLPMIINSFTLYSTSLDTIDYYVTCNILHFHLIINLTLIKFFKPAVQSPKKREFTRDSRSHTSRDHLTRTHWCEANDTAVVWVTRLSAGNQGQKSYEYWWNKVLHFLSGIDINLNSNQIFVIWTIWKSLLINAEFNHRKKDKIVPAKSPARVPAFLQ